MHPQQQTPPVNRKYLVKFTRQNASAVFEYNELGHLVKYELEPGTFELAHFEYLKKAFPKTQTGMLSMISAKLPNVRISEVQADLSFEAFYNGYAHKVSKRKTSEGIWNKMPDTEKAKAIAYIPTYDRYLRESGVNKKYPETYLNSEMWNN